MSEAVPKKGKDFEVVHKEIISRGTFKCRTVVRVVSWGGRPPVLEKRQIFWDEKAQIERRGKLKGLNAWEFEELFKRKQEIIDLFVEFDPRYEPGRKPGTAK